MKSADAALSAYFASRPTSVILADCFTFTLVNGVAARYTAADVPVTYGGNVFAANSVIVEGLKSSIKLGLSVDEQEITVAARPTDTIEGIPFLQAMAIGVLDGAHLQMDRAFLPAWGQPAIGVMDPAFYGRISIIDSLGAVSAKVKVKTELVGTSKDFPRNLYTATCNWTLWDANCGLSKAAHAVSATVAAGSSTSVVMLSGPSDATHFAQGTITFGGSGVLAGVSATIRTGGNSPLAVYLKAPLGVVPSTGTAVMLYPGCDHTDGPFGCGYLNGNRRQFPNVPPPATGL